MKPTKWQLIEVLSLIADLLRSKSPMTGKALRKLLSGYPNPVVSAALQAGLRRGLLIRGEGMEGEKVYSLTPLPQPVLEPASISEPPPSMGQAPSHRHRSLSYPQAPSIPCAAVAGAPSRPTGLGTFCVHVAGQGPGSHRQHRSDLPRTFSHHPLGSCAVAASGSRFPQTCPTAARPASSASVSRARRSTGRVTQVRVDEKRENEEDRDNE